MRAHLPFIVVALVGCVDCGGDASTDTLMMTTAAEDSSTTGHPATSASTTEGATTESEVFDYEGEHVVVIADPELELCGGTMAHMDDFIRRISGRFGVELPTGSDRIRFMWMKDIDSLAEICSSPEYVAACAKEGGQISSLFAPLNHELVHSIAFRMADMHPSPFFTEGMANLHQGHDGLAMPNFFVEKIPMSNAEIMDLILLSNTSLGNVSDGYEKAGRFAAYLIERHGLDEYIPLYAEVPRVAGIEEIDQAFNNVLGVTLAESIAGLPSGWNSNHYDPQLSECNAPEIPWDGHLLEMSEVIYCPRENAIGPYDGDKVAIQYTIEIPVDGAYELRIVGDDQEATVVPDIDFSAPFIGVSILPCSVGKGGFMETQVNGTPRLGQLHAGRNSLRVLGSPKVPAELAFTLRRVPPDPDDVVEGKP